MINYQCQDFVNRPSNKQLLLFAILICACEADAYEFTVNKSTKAF